LVGRQPGKNRSGWFGVKKTPRETSIIFSDSYFSFSFVYLSKCTAKTGAGAKKRRAAQEGKATRQKMEVWTFFANPLTIRSQCL
jgi:hypothetical protein